MTIQIPDSFDNKFGFSDYGTTYDNEAPPTQIDLNRHLDIRIFDLEGITRPRVMSDLDGLAMLTDLDTVPMSELEVVLLIPGETYLNGGGTGAIIDVTPDATYTATAGIGKYGKYNGWRAAKFVCDGAALTYFLDSTWPTGGGLVIEADLTPWDTFSLMVDQSEMATPGVITGVSVQFNNDPNGVFGGGTDSLVYALNGTNAPEWTYSIATAIGAPGGCDLTGVTGIRVTFTDDTMTHPTAGDKFYLLAIRAYTTGYDTSVNTDVNTKRGSAVQPVTLDLAAASDMVPMIRGSEPGLPSDPRPIDATESLLIKTGDLKFATIGSRNAAYLYFREDTDTSSYVQLRVAFYYNLTTKLQIGCYSKEATAVVNNLTLTLADGLLDGVDYFIFEGTVKHNAFRIRLWLSDAGGSHREVLYDSNLLTPGVSPSVVAGTPLVTRRGRVGWRLVAPDRDVSLFAYAGFGLAFSTLITSPANSFNVVDGVQLVAAYSRDDNLFSEFSGVPNPIVDTQRSLSADGSYRTTGPVASNSVYIAADPDQCYLDFDLWVPSQVALGNQPRVVLRSPDESTSDVVLPALDLQGNQWNHVEIELGESAMVPGVIYRVFLERGEGTGTTYEWNVDNFVIGLRNVRWSAQADASDNWIDFRDTVNRALGAVHFPHGSRGTQLQIKAEALTEKAWIAPFSFQPHYAELGKPTYSR